MYRRIAVLKIVHINGDFRYLFAKGNLPFFAGRPITLTG